MNDNKSSVVITGIIAVVAVLGIAYWAMNKTPTTTIVYPPATTTTTQTPTAQTGAPSVSTKSVTFVSQSTAVLNGSVNPNGVQTSYWYEYGPTDSLGIFSRVQLIGGGRASYNAPLAVSGLSPSSTYSYRIAAQNQYGTVYGSILSFETNNTPPVAYPSPNAQTKGVSDLTQTSATISGITNPNGLSTFYWFEYGDSPLLGNTTETSNAGGGKVNTTVTSHISGLEADTTYYYRFDTQNGYGTANGNILSFTTNPKTPLPPPTGKAPTATTDNANGVTKSSAVLHGQVNPNGSQTTYYFEYGKSTLFGIFNLDQKTDAKSAGAGKAVVSTSANLSGLDPNSTYYYRLITNNTFGTDRGAIFSFTTSKK